MSEVSEKKKFKGKLRKGPDLSDIQNYVTQLQTEFKPTLHINGSSYLNCVLTVDFGEPLNPPKITEEEEEILKTKMKAASKLIINRDVTIRVSKDSITNVWWTSVG